MQVEDPAQGTYLMPVVWYEAPPGAKTFFGPIAFTSGIWDRDKPELPPELGEQPPYDFPWYNGRNVWGYTGQCRIGTDAQFANGLSAADLTAPLEAIPTCCVANPPQRTWYLRMDRTPPQALTPAGLLGPWDNQGAPVQVGLLDTVPGKTLQTLPYVRSTPPYPAMRPGVIQYLSAPLPSDEFPRDFWASAIGFRSIPQGTLIGVMQSTLYLVDGKTALAKQTLLQFGQYNVGNFIYSGNQTRFLFMPSADVEVNAGDYLCLELGFDTVQGAPLVPHTYNGAVFDSGNIPIPAGTTPATSPMSVLQYPASPVDTDMPLTGTVISWAGPVLPNGYLRCDGSAVAISAYPDLYAVIGLTYGVAPPGQFRVPDLQGRSPLGVSPGGLGVDRPTSRTLGQAGGEEAHTLTPGELAAHAHSITDPGHDHTVTDPGHSHTPANGANFLTDNTSAGNSQVGPGGDQNAATTSTDPTGLSVAANVTGITVTDSFGASQAHNTMHPFAVIAFIIKT